MDPNVCPMMGLVDVAGMGFRKWSGVLSQKERWCLWATLAAAVRILVHAVSATRQKASKSRMTVYTVLSTVSLFQDNAVSRSCSSKRAADLSQAWNEYPRLFRRPVRLEEVRYCQGA